MELIDIIGSILGTVLTILFGIMVAQLKNLTRSVQELNIKVAVAIEKLDRHDKDIEIIHALIKEVQHKE